MRRRGHAYALARLQGIDGEFTPKESGVGIVSLRRLVKAGLATVSIADGETVTRSGLSTSAERFQLTLRGKAMRDRGSKKGDK